MGDFLFGLLNSFIYLYNMEAKLIKTGNEYLLRHENGKVLAISNGGKEGKKLSLKNCQEIERGYNLDELASERLLTRVDENSGYHKFGVLAYKEGFQKALEVNDDKRFTLEDMMNCWKYARQSGLDGTDVMKDSFQNYLQSFQQTEWDVEIIKEYVGECKGNNNDGCFQDSPGHDCGCYEYKPKFDDKGCLILKRK